MSFRISPLWPAIPGDHPTGRRCATLKVAPGLFGAVWLCLLSIPAIAMAQTSGDRELIRERQERLLQEQRRLDELQQLSGEAPQLQTAPVEAIGNRPRFFSVNRGLSPLGSFLKIFSLFGG